MPFTITPVQVGVDIEDAHQSEENCYDITCSEDKESILRGLSDEMVVKTMKKFNNVSFSYEQLEQNCGAPVHKVANTLLLKRRTNIRVVNGVKEIMVDKLSAYSIQIIRDAQDMAGGAEVVDVTLKENPGHQFLLANNIIVHD